MRNDNEKEKLWKELKLARGRDHKIRGANMFLNRSLCSHHRFKHTARGKKHEKPPNTPQNGNIQPSFLLK